MCFHPICQCHYNRILVSVSVSRAIKLGLDSDEPNETTFKRGRCDIAIKKYLGFFLCSPFNIWAFSWLIIWDFFTHCYLIYYTKIKPHFKDILSYAKFMLCNLSMTYTGFCLQWVRLLRAPSYNEFLFCFVFSENNICDWHQYLKKSSGKYN